MIKINKLIMHIIDIIKNPYLLTFLLYKYLYFIFLWKKTKPIFLEQKIISPDLEKSFIRWWDGETNAALWISFSFEKSSYKLKEYLNNIIKYNWNDIILWLPIDFILKEEKDTKYLKIWRTTRLYLWLKLNITKKYWDAFFFRKMKNINEFQNFYKHKQIFIISNKKTLEKTKNSIVSIWNFEIPYRNSFDNYNNIKNELVNKLDSFKKVDNLLILISWWPFAKALIYDLTIESKFVCHDVWAVFDIYL